MNIFFRTALVFSLVATTLHATDKMAAKLRSQEPGHYLDTLDHAMFMKKGSRRLLKPWKGPMTEEYFATYANKAQHAHKIGTDKELRTFVPDMVSPFARLRNTPRPEIRPWLHWTGHFTKDQLQNYHAFRTYCPLCGCSNVSVKFDSKNPEHAVMSCCGADLYRKNWPDDYTLKSNALSTFRFLDDSIRKIPCTLYTDKQGRVWELFIQNIFNNRDWNTNVAGTLDMWFKRTSDPFYAYKAAVYFDRVKDVYFALPLNLENLYATGKDERGLTRTEWEAMPRPNIWPKMPKEGWWNRGATRSPRGWLAEGGEGKMAHFFAYIRHHPAFKYYSKKKYGDPDKLEKLFITKFCREVCLAYESIHMSGCITNYQAANNSPMLANAILANDQFLMDYAGANHEVSLYNHHYSDGLCGEGSQAYQTMTARLFRHIENPWGESLYNPKFKTENPFWELAASELYREHTVRGKFFEHGDCHINMRNGTRMRDKAPLLDDAPQYLKNHETGSEVWPSWGLGVVRVGSLGNRLETVMEFSRPAGHGSSLLALAVWFDGYPTLRGGGYSAPFANLNDQSPIAELNKLNFPKKVVPVAKMEGSPGDVIRTWSRTLAKSALNQNTIMIDNLTEVNHDNSQGRGLSELVTFKGGGKYGSPEARFQALEVNIINPFKLLGPKVTKLGRAIIGVETPSGKAYAVDILSARGGKNQTLWHSVWGDRIAKNGLPPVVKTYPTLLDAFFDGKMPKRTETFSPMYFYNTLFNYFDYVKNAVERASVTEPWQIDYAIDFYVWMRDKKGKEDLRPSPGAGKVRLRVAGAPDDSRTAIWDVKTIWTAGADQELPSGKRLSKRNIHFENGLDVLGLRRVSDDGKPVESRFVTVFSGGSPDETPVVKQVKTIYSDANARVVEIQLAEGGHDILAYQENNGPLELPNGIKTDARYSLVRFDSENKVSELHMTRGNYLEVPGKSLKDRPEDSGVIASIDGDVTGDRTKSDLLIQTSEDWNVTEIAGKYLVVTLTREAGGVTNNEAYKIKKAEKLPSGLVKVSLAGPAPFIAGWHQVTEFNGDSETSIRTNRRIQKYAVTDWYWGTKVYFPRIAKTFIVKRAIYNDFEILSPGNLKQAGVKKGDWFMIYALEKGMKVHVARSKDVIVK